MKFTLIALATSFVASCSGASVLRAVLPAPTAAEIAAAKEAVAPFCEELNGTRINRIVEDVEGFVYHAVVSYADGFDSPVTGRAGGCGAACIKFLMEGYQFIEAELLIPDDRKEIRGDLIGAPAGLYRYEFVDRSTGRCERFDRMMESKGNFQALARKAPDLFQNMCVTGSPIPAFTADYVYEQYGTVLSRPVSGDGGLVRMSGSRIYERQSGEELASSNFVFYSGYLAYCERIPDRESVRPTTALRPTSENRGN